MTENTNPLVLKWVELLKLMGFGAAVKKSL
jgi:hypothetical protein